MNYPRRFLFINIFLVIGYAGVIMLTRAMPAVTYSGSGEAVFLGIWIVILISPPLVIHRIALMRERPSPFKASAGAMGIYLFLAFLIAQKTAPYVSVMLNLSNQVRTSVDVPAPYTQPEIEEDEAIRELISARYFLRPKDGGKLALCEPTYRAIKSGLRRVEITEATTFGAPVTITDCEL